MWEGYEAAVLKDPIGVQTVLDVADRIPAKQERLETMPSIQNELAYVVEKESRWRPDIVNPNGCVGLIQFCDPPFVGSTREDLKRMSLSEQALYVEKYYNKVLKSTGALRRPGDLYMATFYPEFYNKNDSFIIADETTRSKVWEQNPGLRCSKDGPITVGCVRAHGTPKTTPPTWPPPRHTSKGKGGSKGRSGGLAAILLAVAIGVVALRRRGLW